MLHFYSLDWLVKDNVKADCIIVLISRAVFSDYNVLKILVLLLNVYCKTALNVIELFFIRASTVQLGLALARWWSFRSVLVLCLEIWYLLIPCN